MSVDQTPTLDEFLSAPLEAVAKIAPATVVYGVGGTRRQAAFLGIEPWSDQYVRWARAHTIACADLIFRHGVRNLLVVAFTPDNLREIDQYRDQFFARAHWVLAGEEALADYERLGWRVRLLGAESVPELQPTAALLRSATPGEAEHTFYWNATPDVDAPWRQLLSASRRSGATTRAEAMRALYGEEIPPATLYLAFGKPMVSYQVIPPLLLGQLHCYWSQQPGYSLTARQLRTILYDYAYLRTTWRAAKTARANAAVADRQAWEEGPILGLGMQLGPFWYPAPMSSPAWPPEEKR